VRAHEGAKLSPAQVLVVGSGGGQKLAAHAPAIADYLQAGGHVLTIGLDEPDATAFLPVPVCMKEAEHIAACFDPAGASSLLAGVGPADVHNRDPRELSLITAGVKVIGDGVLARAEGVHVVFCQLVPWQFDDRGKSNIKRTYRRVSFLVTRLLANMGVGGSTPLLARFATPAATAPRSSASGTASTSTSPRNGTTRTVSSAGEPRTDVTLRRLPAPGLDRGPEESTAPSDRIVAGDPGMIQQRSSSPQWIPPSRDCTRRDVLRLAAAGAVAGVVRPRPLAADEPVGFLRVAARTQETRPVEIGNGPHLFLDDEVIDRLEGLERRAEPPERLGQPVLDSATFGCTQPYMTVIRDRETQRYRLWYNRGPAVWHAESEDGRHWANPRVAWDLPRSYGASLVDDGDRARDPERRYKLANWQATRAREDRPGDDGGMYVGFSPDGFRWTAYDRNPVLPTWPEGYGKPTRHGVGDIVDVYYDPLSRHYGAAVKVHAVPEDGYTPGPRAGKGIRRLVGLTTSPDFLRWERPRRIFVPDGRDDGLLEFYGMGAFHVRGALRIGLVRVLRDDLPCDPGGPKDGIGYSVLATSRDGVTWHRRREPSWTTTPSAARGTTP
jgi:hypothetical protein